MPQSLSIASAASWKKDGWCVTSVGRTASSGISSRWACCSDDVGKHVHHRIGGSPAGVYPDGADTSAIQRTGIGRCLISYPAQVFNRLPAERVSWLRPAAALAT